MRKLTPRERFGVYALAVVAVMSFGGSLLAGQLLPAIGIKFTTQTSQPCANTGHTCMYAKSSDDLPYWHKADGTEVSMSGGSGGTSTLNASYAAGTGPSDELMSEVSGKEGVIEKAYAGQTTPLQSYETSGGAVIAAQYQNGKTTGAGYYDTTFATGINTNSGGDLICSAGSANVLELSAGTSAPSITSGIAVYLPTATTPTIAPPSGGTLNLASAALASPTISGTVSSASQFFWSTSVANGSTPAFNFTATNNFTGNDLFSFTGGTTKYLGLEGDTSNAYLNFYASGSSRGYLHWDSSGIEWHSPSDIFYPIVATEWAGSSAHLWGGFFGSFFGKPTTTIASAATIAPTSGLVHVTGTVSVSTITPPTPASGGSFTGAIDIITDSALTFGSGGNIATTGRITTVAGQTYHAVFDGTNWYIK